MSLQPKQFDLANNKVDDAFDWDGHIIRSHSPASEFGQWVGEHQDRAEAQRHSTTIPQHVDRPAPFPSYTSIQSEHRTPEGHVLQVNERPTGSVDMWMFLKDKEGTTVDVGGNMRWDKYNGEVRSIEVPEELRGRGYAKTMLEHAQRYSSQVSGVASPTPSLDLSRHGEALTQRMISARSAEQRSKVRP